VAAHRRGIASIDKQVLAAASEYLRKLSFDTTFLDQE